MTVYDRLGVRTIINGVGAATRVSGAIMPSEVVKAMSEAAENSVDMEQLQAVASEFIATITGAESGLVTSGATAGLTLAAASCVARLDIAKMERLPDTTGMKNEVVIARSQRNAYDHGIRLAGVKLVEAGLNEKGLSGVRTVESWEIDAAITDKTAAIAYVAKPTSAPPLGEVVKVAKKHALPVIVDAAAELPPTSNLRKFIELGASLVVFSGGKGIRGPQSTGILCGERDLIMSAALQMLDMDSRPDTWNPPKNFIDKSRLAGIPRQGIGRGFKVGKEEIIGLLTALEIFHNADHGREEKKFERMMADLVESLRSVQGIEAKYIASSSQQNPPLTEISFKTDDLPYMVRLVERLRGGSPPVYLDESRLDEMILRVNPFNLSEEDIGVIAARLKEAVA